MALAEAGCDVVINGRDEAVLAATAEEIRSKFSVTVTPVAADVGSPEGREALLAACPQPDALVNNNGGPPRRSFRDIDGPAILEGVSQNMVAPLELIRAIIDGMAERKFGRIVNITSFSVLTPVPGLDLSSGARAGLTAYLAGVCREFADANVTINNILPGMMDTDRLVAGWQWAAEKSGRTPAEHRAEDEAKIPARRLGTPEEFGQACAFLCSRYGGYITGQNLLIDGGKFARSF